jgi:DNA-binding NtrC family response regulator
VQSDPVQDLQNAGGEQGESAAILVYGRDDRLLETRRWVLERSGLKVCTTTELSDVEQILATEPIVLFVLCHTLSPEESDASLLKAHALRPQMKNLVLTANTPLGSLGSREEVVSAFEGPRTLLAAVERLLAAATLDLPVSQG